VTDHSLSRRRVLGVAIGGLGLPVLAACAGNEGQTATDRVTSNAATSGGNPPAGQVEPLVATAQVPVGGGVILPDQNVVVTQPENGRFNGFSATCTHQGCLLSSVAGGTINCGCHGSQFSITTGANVTGPQGSPPGSIAPLPKIPVRVKGANVVAT
jgi:nitrite reductase/ring-hydroxylating ferredoxin subunit